jgi:secondary thiamine-phosphate synthase enzyme
MSAHIRTVLTLTELSIPVSQGRAGLGTWQGIFVWEHRAHAHQRRLIVTVQGD